MDGWMDPRNLISLVLTHCRDSRNPSWGEVEFHLIAQEYLFSFGEWKCRFWN